MSRIESPSSINTYNQCPRKYYYHYIEGLPTKPSIHLIRGKVIHSVLEYFFDIDPSVQTESGLRLHLFWLFEKHWNESYSELLTLDLDERKLQSYHEESKMMLQNWFSRFKKKLRNRMDSGMGFREAFEHLTPMREEEFKSENHKVRGFIDAVYNVENNVVILDYKTSKKNMLTDEYRLQLGIYALIYHENHGILPDLVGIDFLKHQELVVPVTQKLVDEAVQKVAYVHSKTESTDINDYEMKPSPLCKWRTGQCDYYSMCFEK